MAFPTSPTNGQQTTQNGIIYTYDSTLTAWVVTTTTPGDITGNNIAITNQVTAGSMTATGTVNAASHTGTTASVTGNVTGGNINTAGLISGTGNVTGGNINTAGLVSVTGNGYFGNVGVGTTSPTTKLSIVSTTNAGISVNDGTVNTILYNTGNTNGTLGTTTNHPIAFYTNNAEKMRLDTSGNLTPTGNGTQDFGGASTRWRNIYTSDLNLSNDYGSWTIVEGAEELFIHNNKNGKVFKFALIEVDPSDSPPKIGTE